ncbi:oxidoreductase [Sphingomonas arantia]|uniref:Oxidoreductase n=1 Tax=Sphingomonas arantia TaxID=1460676 RepID=A0ABW4TZZ5_9SPHN
MPKSWLITGCSSGLGAAIAEEALARGDRVALTARDTEKLTRIAARYPSTTLSLHLDVTVPGSVAAAIATAEQAFGQLDVFVNNAGYGVIGAVEEVSPEEYRQMFETNVFGLIEATRLALPALRRSHGTFVNMSSGSGIATRAGFGLYSSTKFAVEAISEALALEVRPLGVRVVIVEPGAFRTDFLGRSMTIAATRLPIYDETAGGMRTLSESMSGSQPGDPVRAAKVIVAAVDDEAAPLRLPLGPDAHRNIKAKLDWVSADMAAWGDRTAATSFEQLEVKT